MSLFDFISRKMRMSHIYQPVFIKLLLENGGKVSSTQVAKALLNYDFSQIDYYRNIVHNMVGKVLRSHNVVTRDKEIYHLVDFEALTPNEITQNILLCEKKIEDFVKNRGKEPWEHRTRNRKIISGSIRYKVLTRAKSRCECCGISNEIKALEVDHIVPVNLGGENSLNNYQALCYTCNSAKRDTDDTNFSEAKNLFDRREEKCLFCEKQKEKTFLENNLTYAVFDGFPVTQYHTLIIPKRHFSNFFEITQAELNAVYELLSLSKTKLLKKGSAITGFNVGINAGEDAGQTIMHCHIHLIPRRSGDVENPRGGVRHIIPGKGFY